MLIEMRTNLATARGPYTQGKTYDVTAAEAENWLRVGHAAESHWTPRENDAVGAAIEQLLNDSRRALTRDERSVEEIAREMQRLEPLVNARLKVNADTALYLPFAGEVGWLVMWYMRLVHFGDARRKIVCCRRGQECLFPSASEFFYDWTNPVEDALRCGTDRHLRSWRDICARFPGAAAVAAGGLTMDEETIPLRPGESIPLRPFARGLKVDVCIGVRNRKFVPTKNYRHWPWIASELRRRGISFAVIGSRETSYELAGMQCMSGDFGDWDAAVELLQNCKLFIGTDSGGAHLASVTGKCPMIVQQVPEVYSARCFIPRMAMTTPHTVTHLPPETWGLPEAMLLETLNALVDAT